MKAEGGGWGVVGVVLGVGKKVDVDKEKNPFVIIMIIAHQSSVILASVTVQDSHGVGKAL